MRRSEAEAQIFKQQTDEINHINESWLSREKHQNLKNKYIKAKFLG